jgi:hypothetical protein
MSVRSKSRLGKRHLSRRALLLLGHRVAAHDTGMVALRYFFLGESQIFSTTRNVIYSLYS